MSISWSLFGWVRDSGAVVRDSGAEGMVTQKWPTNVTDKI